MRYYILLILVLAYTSMVAVDGLRTSTSSRMLPVDENGMPIALVRRPSLSDRMTDTPLGSATVKSSSSPSVLAAATAATRASRKAYQKKKGKVTKSSLSFPAGGTMVAKDGHKYKLDKQGFPILPLPRDEISASVLETMIKEKKEEAAHPTPQVAKPPRVLTPIEEALVDRLTSQLRKNMDPNLVPVSAPSLLEISTTWKHIAKADPVLVKPVIDKNVVGVPEPLPKPLPDLSKLKPCPPELTQTKAKSLLEIASDGEAETEGASETENQSEGESENTNESESQGESEGAVETEQAAPEPIQIGPNVSAASDPKVIFSRRRHIRQAKPEPDRGLSPAQHPIAKHFVDEHAVKNNGQWSLENSVQNVGGINVGFHNPRTEAHNWSFWGKAPPAA